MVLKDPGILYLPVSHHPGMSGVIVVFNPPAKRALRLTKVDITSARYVSSYS